MGVSRRIEYGMRMPRGYGMCWDSCATRTTRIAPIPLHWLMRWWRDVYYRVSGPAFRSWVEEKEAAYELRDIKRCRGFDKRVEERARSVVELLKCNDCGGEFTITYKGDS